MSRFLFSVTLCLVLSQPGYGQECVDLARVIGMETLKSQSSDQQSAVAQASLCSSDYSHASASEQASISASYELFSAGADASAERVEEMQSQKCAGQFGHIWSDKVNSVSALGASAEGAAVVRACLNSRTFRLTNLTVEDRALTATFTNGNVDSVSIGLGQIVPSNVATCTASIEGAAFPLNQLQGKHLNPNRNLTVTCNRTAEPDKSGTSSPGGAVQHFLPGLVTVAAGIDAAVVPLVEYYKPNISHADADDLRQRIAGLATQVTDLSAQAEALQAIVNTQNSTLQNLQTASGDIFTDNGNNGAVSCQTYCAKSGGNNYFAHAAGVCVAAEIISTPILIGCNDIPTPNRALSCTCITPH